MTVKELIEQLRQYPDDEHIWIYDPDDENEPYKEIVEVDRGPAGDIAIYRE